MTTEFDFTRFVEFLDREEAEKAKRKQVEEITDNRIRDALYKDLRHQNIIWRSESGKG